MITWILALLLLPIAGAAPKESDYTVDFVVKSTSTAPAMMRLDDGPSNHLLVAVLNGCFHCYVLNPGTHVKGRYRKKWPGVWIELLVVDSRGKLKVLRYQLHQSWTS